MDPNAIDLGRRRFLTGRYRAAADKIRPPWSREASVTTACTSCGACAPACPQHIIALDPDGRPSLSFAAADCTFCGACAEACPEPVFDRAATPFDHVAVVGADCFAGRGIVCQSCGDACPEAAIRFRPRLGGPALPELSAERCSGCGACVAICPAAAVTVSALQLEIADG